MRTIRVSIMLAMTLSLLLSVEAQNPPAQNPGARGGGQAPGARGAAPAAQRGGGGGTQAMTVVSTAWPDGGQIPLQYTQVGGEISPAIQWSSVPAGTESFVVIFRDLDFITNNSGPDGLLHWMVWNIPGTATGIQRARPDGFELPDGSRQLSASGPRYRGPGASATGPVHHYLLEVFALDIMLDVQVAPPGPQSPNPNVLATRTAIAEAMATHVRGKGTYFGTFRRPQ